jgi:hypothetical protein
VPRWREWLKDPWGQLVIYLLIFGVLGLALTAFFHWVRGPKRSPYTPFNEGDRHLVDPRR